MRTLAFRLLPCLVTVSLVLGSCGDNDVVAPPRTGTVAIVVVPEGTPGPWQLVGPAGFSRSGSSAAEFTNLATGDYTLSWGELAAWTRPHPTTSTQVLAADDTETFTGIWIEGEGEADGCVMVPAGSFQMGSPVDEPNRFLRETPHRVTLTRPFAIQATEITNQNYATLVQWACDHGLARVDADTLKDAQDGSTAHLLTLGRSASGIVYRDGRFICEHPDRPVTSVTWYGAAAYCDWRSLQEDLEPAYDHATWRCNDGDPYGAAGYRLPTEAEWEYACRAGSVSAVANGPITHTACEPVDANLDALGWYCGNSDEEIHRVAEKNPNAWGLYDTHGNVLEWCNDWLSAYDLVAVDPTGPDIVPSPGTVRIARGGGWYYYARFCRSAFRDYGDPVHRSEHVGFRCVRTTSESP